MRVECINTGYIRGTSAEDYLVVGGIYTVIEHHTAKGRPAYALAETPPMALFFKERFRPITDISSLTKLTKVRELEDA